MLLSAFLWVSSAVAQPNTAATNAQIQSSHSYPDRSSTIITLDGMVYRNAKVQKVMPDGLLINYKPAGGGLGITKIKFQDLPGNWQSYYGYNATNAAAFEKGEAQSASQLREHLLAEDAQARSQRMAEELSDAWANSSASGTGFFITDDGYLLTCYHVVTNATRIQVGTTQGVLPAELVQSDPDNDLALLKVNGTFTALPLANTNSVKLGEAVFTVGFPNPGVQGMAPKLTRGEISSLAGVQDDPLQYQISVPVQPGNSGGAVVDEYGNVVGLVVARLSDRAALTTSGMTAQDVNYAIKSSRAKIFLEIVPKFTDKLKPPYPANDRKFENVVQEAQNAVALIMVE